jgi:protein SCO1/2
MNKKTGLIGAAVAILLPLSFYIVAKVLKKDQLHMPTRYNIEKVDTLADGKLDTVYHKVTNLVGFNQFGDTVSLNTDIGDRILVVYLFFTDCKSICPVLTRHVKLLQHAFRNHGRMNNKDMEKEIQFIGLSVAGEADSVEAMRAYAKQFGINENNWWFINGDRNAIYNYARHELKIQMTADAADADALLHSENIVILDRQRIVRGYYNGLDSNDMKQCADDIALLQVEKEKKRS